MVKQDLKQKIVTFTSLLFSVVSQLEQYSGTQVVVLTAHPDDELLFFGPLLQHVEEHGVSTLILCLTSGGWKNSAELRGGTRQDPGQGALRTSELASLSRSFSAIKTHYLRTPLLDDPHTPWDERLLQTVLYGMNLVMGDTVIIYTFDSGGATGHINHCQIGKAVLAGQIRAKCYFLQTPPRLAWLIPWLYRVKGGQVKIASKSPCQLRSLFLTTYPSQDVWFRRLFLIFAPSMHSNIFSST